MSAWCCVSIRLSAHRKRSSLFPSPACSLVLNISPEPDGREMADSKYLPLKTEKMPLNFTKLSKPMNWVTRSQYTTNAHHISHNSSSLSVSTWAVMMDRRQQRLQLALLPPALFVPAHQDEASRQKSLEALGDTVQPFIIYQETSDIWINVRPNTTTLWWDELMCKCLV